MGEAKIKSEKAKAKKAEFEANPDNFINIHDCLVALIREEVDAPSGGKQKRYATLNNCSSIEDVFMAEGFVRESLQNRRDQIRVIQAQKKHDGIQIVSTMPPLPGSNGHIFPARG